ncbi:MAG: 4-hydroxy-tetrahydrodipicolinate synthase [Pseudomonadota bacterium]
MFKGSMPALITPFAEGRVDNESFANLIEWQIGQGSHGLVPVGTTGESPTLSHDEHKAVVELCVKVTDKRVPIIAGAGSNSTAEAIDFAKHAKSAGADAVLIVMPYYNKPTQAGLFAHIEAINDTVDIPIVLYNVPGRTVADMQAETVARCAQLRNVVGIKDATADLTRMSAHRGMIEPGFAFLTGEDGTALGYNAHGGQGCISVTANVAPRLCADFQEATLRGDFETALGLQDKLFPLHDALFCETSPGPVKYAVSQLGLCKPDLRLPLSPVSDAARAAVDAAMAHAGLTQAKAA